MNLWARMVQYSKIRSGGTGPMDHFGPFDLTSPKYFACKLFGADPNVRLHDFFASFGFVADHVRGAKLSYGNSEIG